MTNSGNIDVYEVYDARDIDYTVFRHEQMEEFQTHVWLLVDGLKDGQSIRIEYRKYTQEQMDEVEYE